MIKQEKTSKGDKKPYILIVSEKEAHIDLVLDYLRIRKVPFFRFNVEDFPQRVTLELNPENGSGVLAYTNGIKVDLQAVSACWYYHSPVPRISSKIRNKANKEFAIGETRATINGLWRLLDDRFWINHPSRLFAGPLYKLKQIQVAKEIGFDVPKSLVTNSYTSVLKFFEKCPAGVILKMMGPPPTVRQMPHVFTSLITKQDVEQNKDKIQLSPILFQEHIIKSFELRITVVGTKVFPAALYTQENEKPKMDWKLHNFTEIRHEKYGLPKDILNKCLLLMRKLGLNYGAIDLIVTPDNKYIFLEVNPSGAWGWIEERLGFPISESIADLLINGIG